VAVFAAAWAAGRALSPAAAFRVVLAYFAEGAATLDRGEELRRFDAPLTQVATWLTTREVEVLRLVAHGLSNRQIADTLVISPRTAEHHVQHLYTKIGASTRAAAAMFAMEHGLLR
jgi:DNA-binding NarL/FixJ family response regulator